MAPDALRVRSDIEEIINKTDEAFLTWYTPRREAVEKFLRDYELFASIPDLRYPTEQTIGSVFAVVENQLHSLKQSWEYLEMIKKLRDSRK